MPWVPVVYRQVGWMPCVACSDSRRLRKGQMWLGHHKNGTDDFITCPECGGTGEVARYQVLDARTGLEIDYEAYGRGADGNALPPPAAAPVTACSDLLVL